MFRALLVGALRSSSLLPKPTQIHQTFFSTLLKPQISSSLLSNPKIKEISEQPNRSVTKYSLRSGKRKSVKSVPLRFYRLDWGGWIRTRCGRNKKIWKKHAARKRRLRQHVFCNGAQSMLLDKMVTSFWRRPKYYVDDPYEPYHSREEFRNTYKNPRPYIPLK